MNYSCDSEEEVHFVSSVVGLLFVTHASSLPTCFAAKGSTTLFWSACLGLAPFAALDAICETKHTMKWQSCLGDP